MHIKTGDVVQVTAGKERGRSGTVLRVDRKRNRVVVEGLNVVKRHKRPSPTDPDGGIIEKEASIHASNVLLYSEQLERGVRTSYRYIGANGDYFPTKAAARQSFDEPPPRIEKVRLCAKTGEVWR